MQTAWNISRLLVLKVIKVSSDQLRMKPSTVQVAGFVFLQRWITSCWEKSSSRHWLG